MKGRKNSGEREVFCVETTEHIHLYESRLCLDAETLSCRPSGHRFVAVEQASGTRSLYLWTGSINNGRPAIFFFVAAAVVVPPVMCRFSFSFIRLCLSDRLFSLRISLNWHSMCLTSITYLSGQKCKSESRACFIARAGPRVANTIIHRTVYFIWGAVGFVSVVSRQ